MKRPDNIVLIGFMGSGKSSVGKLLSKRLGYQFKDTDDMIEAEEGTSIGEIFSSRGEESFRDLETALLLSQEGLLERTVLSTGGGMPLREDNCKLLRMIGQVIYLQASQSTIISRLANDNKRPLLKGDKLKNKVNSILNSRISIYEKAADIIIDTNNKKIADIVEDILEALGSTEQG